MINEGSLPLPKVLAVEIGVFAFDDSGLAPRFGGFFSAVGVDGLRAKYLNKVFLFAGLDFDILMNLNFQLLSKC